MLSYVTKLVKYDTYITRPILHDIDVEGPIDDAMCNIYLAQPKLHDIDGIKPVDDALCNDTLTMYNPQKPNVDFVPLSLGLETHITPCIHNDVVPIYSPHKAWEDVLALISHLIPIRLRVLSYVNKIVKYDTHIT